MLHWITRSAILGNTRQRAYVGECICLFAIWPGLCSRKRIERTTMRRLKVWERWYVYTRDIIMLTRNNKNVIKANELQTKYLNLLAVPQWKQMLTYLGHDRGSSGTETSAHEAQFVHLLSLWSCSNAVEERWCLVSLCEKSKLHRSIAQYGVA